MKVYAISDLHLSLSGEKPMVVFGDKWDGYLDKIKVDWQKKVSADDIVLIAGDISWAMKVDDALNDIKFFSELNGKKVMIRGNHDYWWQSITRLRERLPEGVIALQNDAVKIGNYVILGSRGWAVEGAPDYKETDEKIFKREVERFRLALFAAEKLREEGDKLIAMIHYPPFNVKRESSAFTDLFEQYKVDKVVYGHLHGKEVKFYPVTVKNGVEYILTSCDLVDNTLVEIY